MSNSPVALPALPIRRTKKSDARSFILPNDPATLYALITSGVQLSTATLPGLLQAYTKRGEAHYRDPFAHLEEISAAHDNPVLQPLVWAALTIADLAERIREIIKAAQAEPDPVEASRLLDLAATYGWTAADKGDRLAVEIGKLAQVIEAA